MIVEVHYKSRWTAKDKAWLLETCEYQKKRLPESGELLRKEVDKV